MCIMILCDFTGVTDGMRMISVTMSVHDPHKLNSKHI